MRQRHRHETETHDAPQQTQLHRPHRPARGGQAANLKALERRLTLLFPALGVLFVCHAMVRRPSLAIGSCFMLRFVMPVVVVHHVFCYFLYHPQQACHHQHMNIEKLVHVSISPTTRARINTDRDGDRDRDVDRETERHLRDRDRTSLKDSQRQKDYPVHHTRHNSIVCKRV